MRTTIHRLEANTPSPATITSKIENIAAFRRDNRAFCLRSNCEQVLGTVGITSRRRTGTHLVLASSSDSKVFCLLSSSISVIVTSFSLGDDSATEMGGVTPRYLRPENEKLGPDSGTQFTHCVG